jgi:ribonuclease D
LYITNADELADWCDGARGQRLVAIDTEFIRDRSYFPKLCLVQLATHESIALVDPLAIDDLSALADLLADERLTKVFHACTQDLEVLLDSLGVLPRPLFDTQVAAAFLGMRQQASYANLVEEYCGVRLSKQEALTDWTARPLTASQLAYAEDDVRYLPDIYDQMMARLVELDRLGWVLPEMEALLDKAEVERDPRQAFKHLKRSSVLTRRQLAIAREACAWREACAAEHNIPRRWVIADEVLVECCRRAPRSVPDLRRIRGTEKLSESDAAALVKALKAGRAASTDDLPRVKRHDRVTGEAEGVVDLMNAVVRVTSKECGIAPQILASRDDLTDLLHHRAGAALTEGWRHEVVGERLERLLAGELALTVRDGRIDVL